jgi:hypothetical protein
VGFYDDLYNHAVEIRTATPVSQVTTFEKYGNLNATMLLAQEVTMATNRANDLQAMFESAKYAVVQINSQAWAFAESRLRTINDEILYRNPYGIADERRLLLSRLQDNLFYAVKDASRQRADMFAKTHESTVENISALYNDSAFVPVYQLTFSSTGQADLVQKRKEIEGYLDQLKYYQFPSNSIKALYREFTKNVNVGGVEKARAIAEHGKFYRGDDKQVKGLVDECDVNVAKWIVKPKEYRKLYALPVSSNKQGANEYMFRIRLQIPSEAEFPVFDVNIKLPQEIAENAGRQQWYDVITINGRPIKNEGRFTITSPTPDNGYESQISPVQMDKEGRNILEVRFTYPAYKVLEVSAMAQVPIIRKN